VVVEATYAWYWVVDLLQASGARVHLANPQGLNSGQRRVKNDERDAIDLVDMLRLGWLPEAWIARRRPGSCGSWRATGPGSLACGRGSRPRCTGDGQGGCAAHGGRHVRGAGNAQLDGMAMADNYTTRVESLRALIGLYDREVTMLEGEIHRQLRHHPGYQAIQAIDGVGRTIAAVLVAEIDDVDRFRSAEALCSWAGLTPKHRESDTKTTRGPITKQGSRLVRWALIEAVSRDHGGPRLAADFRGVAERRGTNKARVAVACKVLTLVYLLRSARRRDPLPRSGPSGVRLGHDQTRASHRGDPRLQRRGRRTA
jgi:transposase